jgi:hypothetical protein
MNAIRQNAKGTALLVRLLVLLIGVILTGVREAKADPVLLGASFAFPPQTGFQVQQNQFLAQAFTLTQTVSATALKVQLYASATITAPFLVQLTSGLGPAVPVLAEEAFMFPSVPHDTPQVFSLHINLLLIPGMYFVVLSSTFTSGTLAWGPQTALPSTVGNTGLSFSANNPPQNTDPTFPPGSNWSVVTAGPEDRGPLQFQIEGTPVEDLDGDGISDDIDTCPETPAGAVVNAEGCAIVQLCPCEDAWKNHGAYVKCVVQAAEDFVVEGLLTEAEKDAIVSEAARSSCGRK